MTCDTRDPIHEAEKHCVICDSDFPSFRPFASRRRMVQCPKCKSIDRNRLVYLYIRDETDLLTARASLLHVAPEKVLGEIFSKSVNLDYYPVDIDPKRPFVREAMDIQNIHFPNDKFDYIICSHVLEHIPDDRAAIRHLARILKPGGQALILVPLKGEKTLEDPAYNTDELRRLHYGGVEHVRFYGIDIIDRLKAAGFEVDPLRYSDKFSPGEVARNGLARERIFVCRKRRSPSL